MNETRTKWKRRFLMPLLVLLMTAVGSPADAAVFVQCPGDSNGDAIPEPGAPGYDPNVQCMHLAAGDAFALMGDGSVLYTFGFSNQTGVLPANVMSNAILAVNQPAPTMIMKEGGRFYLTLTNNMLLMRPDLFDAHSVHFHGLPNASPIFDGLPESAITIAPLASFTYFYAPKDPGTYLYHCHVEVVEHMQMGMIGNLWVTPLQNNLPAGTNLNGFIHQAGYKYAYNDGDGTTRYDAEFPIQITGFDSQFHTAHINVQPLPFWLLMDDYPLLNGRGYPDTVNPNALTIPAVDPAAGTGAVGKPLQPVSALIQATAGQKILLRITNVSVDRLYTLSSPAIPMTAVGKDAKILRSASGQNLYVTTHSVTLGGGESMDVILDTTGMAAGTYPFYTTNLHMLANGTEPFGGVMTEIVLNP